MRHLQALCVARHRFLAEHFARFFSDAGVDTIAAVGLNGAVAYARQSAPDVVVCEYDLLATLPIEVWEHDPVLRQTPVIAVSLTRHSDEMHPLDVNGIAGFLYLPMLRHETAHQVIHAAAVQHAATRESESSAQTIIAPAASTISPLEAQ